MPKIDPIYHAPYAANTFGALVYETVMRTEGFFNFDDVGPYSKFRNEERALRQGLLPELGHVLVSALTVPMLVRAFSRIPGVRARNAGMTLFRRLEDAWVMEGLMYVPISYAVRLKRIQGPMSTRSAKKTKQTLREHEVTIWRNALPDDPEMHLMFTLVLEAGLRPRAVASLRLKDLEPLPDGGAYAYVNEDKDGSKVQYIPVDTWRTIEPLVDELAAGRGVDDTLFHRYYTAILTSMRKCATAARLPGVSVYSLRYTFARRLVESGVDIEVIRAAMHHSSVQQTRSYLRGLEDLSPNGAVAQAMNAAARPERRKVGPASLGVTPAGPDAPSLGGVADGRHDRDIIH